MAIKSKTVKLQEDKTLKELEQQLHQLEKDTKDGNSNDSRILNQIEGFANKAKSMHYTVNHNGSMREEKAHLVNAAKQFKEIITEVRKINSLERSL